MCGIFGIANHPQAAYLAYLGLHALQHRGEEACGIVSSDGIRTWRQVDQGLINECFDESRIKKLKGDLAIGHVRYSTSGGSLERNCQPLIAFNTPLGEFALAHNGNIPGHQQLRRALQQKGALFYTDSDTEVLLVSIAQLLQKKFKSQKAISPSQLSELFGEALACVLGAYSMVMLAQDFLVAIRDPWGVRPLVLGQINGAHVFASETNAFDLIGAEFIREVEPGEIVMAQLRKKELKTFRLKSQSFRPHPNQCIFELVYFARPDSRIFNRDVYETRRNMGRWLAREAPVQGMDYVIPVPDSANVQALGFAEESKLPCEIGFVRSHYIGRTFIAPRQEIRDFSARLKYNPVRGLLKNKKIVVVDDSIVRGTTSKKLIRVLRQLGGAKEVHLRIASPPIKWPCFYGIDMPTKKELIAANKTVNQIKDFLGVESLAYLSLKGMLKTCPPACLSAQRADLRSAGRRGGSDFCTACFSGEYRIAQTAISKIVDSQTKLKS